MSRSGYSDGCDGWTLIRWRGAVESALRGRRGQAFLKELLVALDGMPVKELVSGSFERAGGCCTLGAVARTRNVETGDLADLAEWSEGCELGQAVGQRLDIATAMACEIMYENDEHFYYNPDRETPEARWTRMRAWVEKRIA